MLYVDFGVYVGMVKPLSVQNFSILSNGFSGDLLTNETQSSKVVFYRAIYKLCCYV